MASEPIFAAAQPDGSLSVIDLSTPGAYQDFAFTAVHADGRHDLFRAYHTGELAIFCDVLTLMATERPRDTVLADIARIRTELAAYAHGLTPTSSQPRSRPMWPTVLAEAALPFSNSYTVDGRSRRVGLLITGNRYGLQFSERRGRQRGFKVAIAADELWRFAAGMMWRSYEEDRAPLSRVGTDEFEDALVGLESVVGRRPLP